MWISVSPVTVVMRSTTRACDCNTSGIDIEHENTDGRREQESGTVKPELVTFLSENSCMLLGLFFLILVAEEYHTTERDVREHRFLFILFEFCSAYGTVGLSMSAMPWSRSGKWSIFAKVCLMLVMLLGRLRGLPTSIDPTFQFETSGTNPNDRLGTCTHIGSPKDDDSSDE